MTNALHCKQCATDGTERNMCITHVPIFNHLTIHEMKEIVKVVTPVHFNHHEFIFRANEKSDCLYIIHKGRVKIYRLSEVGKEQVIRILGQGEFVGELSLFTEGIHDTYAETMEPVELCAMRRDDFQRLLLTYPMISLKVLSEFSTRLMKAEKQAANIALESVQRRISLYLIDLFYETEDYIVTLPMSRKDLASHLGTSPESISRKLSEFEELGWIEQINQRKIRILDVNALLMA